MHLQFLLTCALCFTVDVSSNINNDSRDRAEAMGTRKKIDSFNLCFFFVLVQECCIGMRKLDKLHFNKILTRQLARRAEMWTVVAIDDGGTTILLLVNEEISQTVHWIDCRLRCSFCADRAPLTIFIVIVIRCCIQSHCKSGEKSQVSSHKSDRRGLLFSADFEPLHRTLQLDFDRIITHLISLQIEY